jgi:hypothetical protein
MRTSNRKVGPEFLKKFDNRMNCQYKNYLFKEYMNLVAAKR